MKRLIFKIGLLQLCYLGTGIVQAQNSDSLKTSNIQEVVVTALGIKKDKASLGYSTQQLSGKDLTQVQTTNLMQSLGGKVAGMSISQSAGGLGNSVKVTLRGARSASGNNQPLYVVDGIPLTNEGNGNGQENSLFGGSPEGGDGIENLNPDDIESISILKGASAAALYGSQAQNGVILITTKQGRAGKALIQYTSNFSLQNAVYEPKFQNQYGQTNPGSTSSWGAPISKGYNNLDQFFQTGTNLINSVSLSAGSDKAKTYFSFANNSARGIQPRNTLNKNNFYLHEIAKFLNDKLTVDGSVTYVYQKIKNNPAIGFYLNPLVGLYLFPSGESISQYKDQYENPDLTGPARQNWFVQGDDLHQQNPWWVVNRDLNSTNRNRIILTGSLKYEFTDWLNLQVKGNFDRSTDDYLYQRYSGTDPLFNTNGNGNMGQNQQTVTQKYTEALLTVSDPNKDSKFQINGILGASLRDIQIDGTNIAGDLSTPDYFSVGNIIAAFPSTSNTVGAVTPNHSHSQLQSVYGSVDASYDDWAFLTITGRNDWSSNLSFTPNVSFFYPSVGLSVVLSRALSLPQAISYLKLRGTYAQVGNTVPSYLTNLQNTQSGSGQLNFNTNQSFRTLKPEKTNSYEFGWDVRFIRNRYSFSFTYYKTNTHNQFIPVTPPVASLISTGFVNAGNIQNQGIEFILGADIFKGQPFKWTATLNGSYNKNKIIDVDSKDGIDSFILTDGGGNSYQSRIVKGGAYGDIYGVTFKRDDSGKIMFSGDGSTGNPYTPLVNSAFGYLGNPNPKVQLGLENSFTYKNFNLDFLLSGRFGGQVLSITHMIMDQFGVSTDTGAARKAGSVKVNGVDGSGNAVTDVDPQTWYTSIGGRQGISETGIYSATVVRLRELSLSYKFNLKTTKVRDLSVGITGRNLFYLYKKAPFDPELTMSTGNGLSGVDLFTQPATREIGIKLSVSF